MLTPAINAIGAKQHQVHPYREIIKTKQQMLTPTFNIIQRLPCNAVRIHFIGVAFGRNYSLMFKGLQLFFQDNDDRTFGHKIGLC